MTNHRPPSWFWLVSITALIWNLLGVLAFFFQMTLDTTSLPAPERNFYQSVPVWASAGFAVAVFAGVLGCIALLLKRQWALPLLILSVAGLAVQTTHSIFVSNGIEVFGLAGLIMPGITFAISITLIKVAQHSVKHGWLA